MPSCSSYFDNEYYYGIMTDAVVGVASGDLSYAMVLGIPTSFKLSFGGLIAGIIAAICYKKFYKTELPAFLGFFAGKRLVPIMTAILAFLVGLACQKKKKKKNMATSSN